MHTAEQSKQLLVQTSTRQILLIDQDPQIRLVLKRFLELIGFSVYQADSLETVLAQPDLPDQQLMCILMDLGSLPLVGFAQTLTARHRFPDVPLMLMTAGTLTGMESWLTELGVVGLLLKPFGRRDLEAAFQQFAP